jgi:HAD superfamily hydrolase (TIGR01509 family)
MLNSGGSIQGGTFYQNRPALTSRQTKAAATPARRAQGGKLPRASRAQKTLFMSYPALTTLIFDVDGTLADTEEIHRIAFNQAFTAAGLDWHWSVERYGELLAVTGGRERIRHFMELEGLTSLDRPDLDGWIAGLHRAKTALYTDMLATGRIPLRPGVRRLLTEARAAGFRLAIATTTSPPNVAALLRHSLAKDGEHWFEVIAAGDVVPKKKPAPDIYLHALRELGADPAGCLAFEDSENGVKSALGAGIATLVTENAYTNGHDFSGAVLVLDHFGEPDHPCTVLAGSLDGARYVDVAALRKLHATTFSG